MRTFGFGIQRPIFILSDPRSQPQHNRKRNERSTEREEKERLFTSVYN